MMFIFIMVYYTMAVWRGINEYFGKEFKEYIQKELSENPHLRPTKSHSVDPKRNVLNQIEALSTIDDKNSMPAESTVEKIQQQPNNLHSLNDFVCHDDDDGDSKNPCKFIDFIEYTGDIIMSGNRKENEVKSMQIVNSERDCNWLGKQPDQQMTTAETWMRLIDNKLITECDAMTNDNGASCRRRRRRCSTTTTIDISTPLSEAIFNYVAVEQQQQQQHQVVSNLGNDGFCSILSCDTSTTASTTPSECILPEC